MNNSEILGANQDRRWFLKMTSQAIILAAGCQLLSNATVRTEQGESEIIDVRQAVDEAIEASSIIFTDKSIDQIRSNIFLVRSPDALSEDYPHTDFSSEGDISRRMLTSRAWASGDRMFLNVPALLTNPLRDDHYQVSRDGQLVRTPKRSRMTFIRSVVAHELVHASGNIKKNIPNDLANDWNNCRASGQKLNSETDFVENFYLGIQTGPDQTYYVNAFNEAATDYLMALNMFARGLPVFFSYLSPADFIALNEIFSVSQLPPDEITHLYQTSDLAALLDKLGRGSNKVGGFHDNNPTVYALHKFFLTDQLRQVALNGNEDPTRIDFSRIALDYDYQGLANSLSHIQ